MRYSVFAAADVSECPRMENNTDAERTYPLIAGWCGPTVFVLTLVSQHFGSLRAFLSTFNGRAKQSG